MNRVGIAINQADHKPLRALVYQIAELFQSVSSSSSGLTICRWIGNPLFYPHYHVAGDNRLRLLHSGQISHLD